MTRAAGRVTTRTTLERDGRTFVYEVLADDVVVWRKVVRYDRRRGATRQVRVSREQSRIAARLAAGEE